MFRSPSCATTPPTPMCLPPSRKSTSFPTSGGRRRAGGSHPVRCSVPMRFISTRLTRRVVPSRRRVLGINLRFAVPSPGRALWRAVDHAHIRTTVPASEFMTDYEEWLAIQNGAAPKRKIQFNATPRYIATGRDLAAYVHLGPALGWAAALILATPGGGADPRYSGMYPPAKAVSYPSNPYRKSKTQAPAGATFGLSYIQATRRGDQ